MPVTRKQESLGDEQIKKVSDIKIPPEGSKKDEKLGGGEQEEKPGFLKSTIQELKKVEWPTWKYTLTWGSVVVLFTIVMSLSLGFFDHIFDSGIKYVDCTASYKTSDDKTTEDNYKECGNNLVNDLTFKE